MDKEQQPNIGIAKKYEDPFLSVSIYPYRSNSTA